MPFVNLEEQIALSKAIGQDELGAVDNATWKEKLAAAYRLENTIGSFFAKEGNLPDSSVTHPEFNPVDYLTEAEKMDDRFLSQAVLSDNTDEINSLRRQRDRENADRQILANGAFFETALSAIADPINLIPVGGTAYTTYKSGASILTAGVATAGASAGSASIAEAGLHYSQIQRTFGESAVNVGAASLFGAILGVTPQALRKVFSDAGHDPDAAFKQIERSMHPERSTLTAEDIESIKAKEVIKIKEELLPGAGNKLSRSDRKSLVIEKKDLEYKLSKIQGPTKEDIKPLIAKRKGEPARISKEKAKKEPAQEVTEQKKNISDSLAVIDKKLELDRLASIDEADLTRLDQGIIPDRFQERMDTLVPDQKIIEDGGEINTVFDDDELRSVGAAQVMNDINVRGKLARAMTKFLGFDPLSKTITSDVKDTRLLASRLAENPIAMDQSLGVSVESRVKTVSDGFLYEGVQGHHDIFKEYKKQGGKLARQDFNAEVSKAIRNGSDDELVQKAADHWQKTVYDPIKNKAVSSGLLDEGVEVTTASNYLNRLWNKEKVAANLPRFKSIVADWLQTKQEGLDLEDAEMLATEISTRLMGTADGMLPYYYKIGENVSNAPKGSGLKGPFKKRVFDIDDELVEDFLENDIELVASRYVQNTVPDIELVREFGDVNMTAELKGIDEAWQEKMDAAPNEKARKKLNKKREGDSLNVAAMRDRIRGNYKIPDSNNPWVRAGRVARDLNYMRLLGGVVAASIPDVARVVMAEGIGKVFSKGLMPLAKNLSSFKMSANEAKLYGVGTDALMGGRAEIIADVADYARGGTAFERGVRSAANKFSSINLMNQWTAGIKQLHAVVAQTRIADDLIAGKVDPRLGQLGIDNVEAKNIASQLKKYGKKIDGVWVANTKDWDNVGAVEIWSSGIRKESDRVIIVPGQERPLFMSSELGKTIFQFKTFMFSATQRVLISALQDQDKHAVQGMLGLISIGAMSYAFKQWDAGREVSDDPRTLILEGIDRSGALGWLMEANNTIEKVTGNSYGLRPMFGVSAPASRYASRSTLDSLVGPSFGLAGDAIKVMSAATDQHEWGDADTRAIRRLLPGQNLSLFRQWIDQLEKEL